MSRCFLIFIIAGLLTSCVSVTDAPGPDTNFWSLDGKLSIKTKNQSRIVSINWQQRGDYSDIHLNGPLGAGEVHIMASGDELVIETGGESRVHPIDQGFEVEGESFRLPWGRLAYWVRGLQGPDMKPIDGEFSQDDWSVRVLSSDTAGPGLIEFNHPAVSLRLKVRNWREEPRTPS